MILWRRCRCRSRFSYSYHEGGSPCEAPREDYSVVWSRSCCDYRCASSCYKCRGAVRIIMLYVVAVVVILVALVFIIRAGRLARRPVRIII